MRLVVLIDKRSSLCFVLMMIVQAVLLWTPSAFACLSKATQPSATKASAMCQFWLGICAPRTRQTQYAWSSQRSFASHRATGS